MLLTAVTDPSLGYFGGRVPENAIVPDHDEILGTVRFSNWLFTVKRKLFRLAETARSAPLMRNRKQGEQIDSWWASITCSPSDCGWRSRISNAMTNHLRRSRLIESVFISGFSALIAHDEDALYLRGR